MTWKSLFCALSDVSLVRPSLDHAAELSARIGAHLDVMAVGVNRCPTDMYFAGASALSVQHTLDQCKKEADANATEARRVLCMRRPRPIDFADSGSV